MDLYKQPEEIIKETLCNQADIKQDELAIKRELDKLGLSYFDRFNAFDVTKDGDFVGSFFLDDDEQWHINIDMYEYFYEN